MNMPRRQVDLALDLAAVSRARQAVPEGFLVVLDETQRLGAAPAVLARSRAGRA